MMDVFDIFNSKLPGLPLCENLRLAFNQYLRWKEQAGKRKPDLSGLVDKWKCSRKMAGKLKKALLDYQSRHQAIVQELEGLGYKKIDDKFTTSSRLVVGLGNPNPSENGLTFHHVYGFPIIPGSAQKGLCAHYVKDIEGKTETDSVYQEIFGGKTQKGKVVFLDAFPLLVNNAPPEGLLDLDIMNPHYQEYYGNKGGTAPADYLSPNPILFLAVGFGVPFQFTLMASNKHKNLLDMAGCWLKSALKIMGIGGKTQVGYGRLS
jgi:CRISPR-associated protein Cmr6